MRAEFDLQQAAVREGMADVYVALKQLKRTAAASRPQGMEGAQLESVLMGLARRYPNNVQVVP